MAAKPKPKPKIRTLPDGYKIEHHEPDKKHPTGKKVLVPGQSRLRERLLAAHPDKKAAHQEVHAKRQEALKQKQDAENSKGVPNDKRFC